MTDKIESVVSDLWIEDGRVEITDTDRDANLYVDGPNNKPLSKTEPHASLVISAENSHGEIQLDGEQLDALIDALYHIQQND